MSDEIKIKLIKDVVHGYIELEPEYITLINTPEFQRLKNIRQTSYTALYPSSSHDRFSHSLGVFALGKYAFNHFKNNVIHDFPTQKDVLTDDFWKSAQSTFLSACLLHDVGHSPFSHTSEEFYKIPTVGDEYRIEHDLKTAVNNDEDFAKNFIQQNTDKPKPHEIMSAIIGIKLLDKFEMTVDKVLFARMITGIAYTHKTDFKFVVYNALISLLHSPIIDVDRLDYILRDSLMTGYNSVSIDTSRLLSSVCIVNILSGNTDYRLGFYKNAISIVENVIIAHDLERRWIQYHAAIAYDTILVQRCAKSIESAYSAVDDEPDKPNTIFREEALSPDGIDIQRKGQPEFKSKIRLLCDADILYLAKQIPESDHNRCLIDEYFDRSLRKRAIWKTEAEFNYLMSNTIDDDRNTFLFIMNNLLDSLDKKGENFIDESLILNENTIPKIDNEFEKRIEADAEKNNGKDKDIINDSHNTVKRIIEAFKISCEKFEIDFDIVIKRFDKFTSGTAKLDSSKIYIKFGEIGRPFNKIIKSYRLNDEEQEKAEEWEKHIFYIYYKPRTTQIDPLSFINTLLNVYKKV